MSDSGDVGRFAPSLTGEAHPGTFLAALLCWLDARSRGAQVLLRLEDLDRSRFRPEFETRMLEALEWFGLSFDRTYRQSERRDDHERALDALAAQGLLYPCSCSRAQIKSSGRRAPDGGFAYDNRCRVRPLEGGDWRACKEPLRLRLPDERVELVDELGNDLSQHPAHEMGDPVVVRRDSAVAYHLAVVVDDIAAGVTRVVRGRDLAASSATQVLIYHLLHASVPSYAHHLLLLERRGSKLAKLHGSIGYTALAERYRPEEFCGKLAALAGLQQGVNPVTPRDLLQGFDWNVVARDDVLAEL
jgi:glutamyl/glutaminyl-tRNA synthetase